MAKVIKFPTTVPVYDDILTEDKIVLVNFIKQINRNGKFDERIEQLEWEIANDQ
jgi:hypothetical protein